MSTQPKPIYTKLVEQLLTVTGSSKTEITKYICQSQHFTDILTYIEDEVSKQVPPSRKISLHQALIDLIVARGKPLSELDLISRNSVLHTVIDYPNNVTEMVFYDKLEKCLKIIFKSYPENQNEETVKILSEPPTIYSSYALVILAQEHKSLAKDIFVKITKSINSEAVASMEALVLYYKTFELKDIESSGVYEEYFNDQRFEDFIKPLLMGDEKKKCGALHLLTGILHFLPADRSIPIFMGVASAILEMLAVPSIAKDAALVFSALPTNASTEVSTLESQLRQFLPSLAERVTDLNTQYAEAVIKFAVDRKSVESIIEIIKELLTKANAVTAAVAIGCAFGMTSDEEKATILFPPTVSSPGVAAAVLAAIPYAIDGKYMNNFKAPLTSFYNIISSNVVSDPKVFQLILPAAHAVASIYPRAADTFLDTFVTNCSCENIDILKFLATEFSAAVTKVSINDVDRGKFSKLFIRIASTLCDDIIDLFGIMRVFKPEISKAPSNIVDLIDQFVPGDVAGGEARVFVISLLQEKHRYAAVAAALPNLTSENLLAIVDTVCTPVPVPGTKENDIDTKLFVSVFHNLSLRYPKAAVERLHEIASRKEKRGLFTSSKEKKIQASIKRATIAAIADVASNYSMPPDDAQSLIYSIITSALPSSSEMVSVAEEASKLVDVFPKLSSVVAPTELLNKVVSVPLFAMALPDIVTKQKGADKYAENILRCWLAHLKIHNIRQEKSKDIAQLLFRISPTQKTYEMVIKKITKRLSESDPLPYVDFAAWCVLTASAGKVPTPSKDLGAFFVATAPLCLSNVKETRIAAFSVLINSVGVAKNESDQMKETMLDLSPEAAVHNTILVYEQAIQAGGKDLMLSMLSIIQSKKHVPLSNLLVIRAALSVAGASIFKDSPNFMTWLIQVAPSMSDVAQYHINKALTDLSSRSMKDFFVLLIAAPSLTYKRELVLRILQDDSRKALFFEQFMATVSTVNSLAVFSLMPAVVRSETSPEISPKAFGTLTATLISWLAVASANEKKMKMGEAKSTKEDMMSCLSYIISHTNLTLPPKFELHFREFIATLKSVCGLFLNLDNDRLIALCSSCVVLLKSPADSVKLAAAVSLIEFLGMFGLYTDAASINLCGKLGESIAIAFGALSPMSALVAAKEFNATIFQAHAKHIRADPAGALFASCVKAIPAIQGQNPAPLLSVAAMVAPVVSKSEVIGSDEMLAALKAAAAAGFSMPLLELLEMFVSARCRFVDFSAGNAKLNLFFLIASCRNQRMDIIQRVSTVIGKLNASIEKPDQLRGLFVEKELASFGYHVITEAEGTTMTSEIMDLLLLFAQALTNISDPNAVLFNERLCNLAASLLSGGPFTDKAALILSTLIH